jgi:hypothetical protein
MRKILYAAALLTCVACGSTKNLDRQPTRQEIERDFQKAYNANTSRPPVKKQMTTITWIGVILTAITLHFTTD